MESPSRPVPVSADRLLVIVEVDREDRVLCQQPGCGHGVYKRIHVVRADGKLKVLGSTCFEKVYGGSDALGRPQIGGNGGQRLTPEQRALLEANTAELLAQLEAAENARHELMRERLAALKQASQRSTPPPSYMAPREPARSAVGFGHVSPWPWAKPLASLAYFRLWDGTGWTRVQHSDGRQLLAPYPIFNGWGEALPASIGTPDVELQALVIADLRSAVANLSRVGDPARVGIWRDIAPDAIKQLSKR